MYNLFLDDERDPSHVTWMNIHPGPWVIIRTQADFERHVLENGMPDTISWDNDLGDGMGEGRFCARWLVDRILDGSVAYNPHFTFTVHSQNPVASEWITQYLNQFIGFYASER